jgi:hypothetical protein
LSCNKNEQGAKTENPKKSRSLNQNKTIMKKVKFILPLVAVLFAVVGVFATESSKLALVDVDVTANAVASCIKDGVCNQSSPSIPCQLTSTPLVKFYKTSDCSTQATGLFIEQ